MDGVPQQIHDAACGPHLRELPDSREIRFFLCPERKISFDGFVNYEGRRFGVPYSYPGAAARVMRSGDTLYIYSSEVFSGAVTALILKMVTLKIENHTIALCVKKVRDLAKSKDFDRNSWKLCDKADERGLNPMTIKEILELAGIPLKKSYIPKSLRKKLQ